MSFSRYALINTGEELLSVLESHIGTDQMEDGQKQKQIRIVYLSGTEKEPGSLQELLSLPRIACRVAIYEGPGLTFPRKPKYFEDYKNAIFYTLKELICEDTHSATVEVFESATGEASLGATLSAENLKILGIA